MEIDIGDIKENLNQRSAWNNTDLEDITVIDMDGKRVKLTKQEIEDWRLTGLNNFEFLVNKFL
jgi:hypothetical protein